MRHRWGITARAVLIGAALVARAAIAPPAGNAAGTDPTMAMDSAEGFAAANGTRAVLASGAFSFDDLMQFSFPTGLIVTQGSNFARYDLNGEARSGSSAAVADGVSALEIPGLLAAGSPASAPAALQKAQPGSILVTLPASFTAGTATAIFYTVIGGDPFVSNAVNVVLP
jgi:hypothetical protein